MQSRGGFVTRLEAYGLYLRGFKPTFRLFSELYDAVKNLQVKNNELEKKLALAKRHPSTPSGMKAAFTKANAIENKKRKKSRPQGRRGGRRPLPRQFDRIQEHVLMCCSRCNTPLPPSRTTRERCIEGIEEGRLQVIRHVIYRYWCKTCKKIVEATVTDALPKSTIGLFTMIYSAWLHYILTVSIDKVIALLSTSARLKISAGGLFGAWHHLGEVLKPLYEQIGKGAKHSAKLHADETGWRVKGVTHWVWCFAGQDLVYYLIDRHRSTKVAMKVLGRFFHGILITDFLASYNQIRALAKQKCLVHLLRELIRVSLFDFSPQWKAFSKELKRLVLDALRLGRQRDELDPKSFERRKALLQERLVALYTRPYSNENAQRLSKRLEKHSNEILTFLDHPGVSGENNYVERMMRLPAQSRKISGGNRSQRGAEAQAMLMSIFRTLQLRGYEPVSTLVFLIQEHLKSGKPIALPPALPSVPPPIDKSPIQKLANPRSREVIPSLM
jgi:transposase